MRSAIVQIKLGFTALLAIGLVAGVPVWSQSSQNQNTATSQTTSHGAKNGRSAGGDVGSGSGDIGKGAGKGAGNLAAGAGKGAGELATLHPLGAAASVGKGGASAGKNVAVGTTKGTGKIGKGVGKGIKHIF